MLFRYFVYILHIFLQEFVQFMCHKFPCAFRDYYRTSLGLRWAFCGNSFAERSCERNILNYWTKRTDSS